MLRNGSREGGLPCAAEQHVGLSCRGNLVRLRKPEKAIWNQCLATVRTKPGKARWDQCLATARMQIAAREIVLWTTPSEPPKALQASECSELLDPMRASCLILAQHQPGKFITSSRTCWPILSIRTHDGAPDAAWQALSLKPRFAIVAMAMAMEWQSAGNCWSDCSLHFFVFAFPSFARNTTAKTKKSTILPPRRGCGIDLGWEGERQ